MLTRKEAESLLDSLCVKLGFCLGREAYERLAEVPPESADDFTRAIFEAERLDPVIADRTLVRAVEAMIVAAFERSASRRSEP